MSNDLDSKPIERHRSNGELVIVWENVTIDVPCDKNASYKVSDSTIFKKSKVKSTEILKGVSGYAESGNLIAIMGPSGAGKTTLLAALAHRIKLDSGSVKINGYAISKKIMSKISSFMPQFDAMPLTLTLWEYMLFACALKMDRGSNPTEKYMHANDLLTEVGLSNHKDTLIANLSGGQRKRLSLATELITKPQILFLDEPTTGLDRFAAMRVVRSLKLISSSRTIVFCTIHQPGMAIYNIFSHVIFMADGRIAYAGSLENAACFFNGLGFCCPSAFDEAEYYVNILSCQSIKSERYSTDNRPAKISDAFSRSPFSKLPAIVDCESFAIITRKSPNWLTQFYWIMWRIYVHSQRTILRDWMSWVSYLAVVFLVASFYFGINSGTQNGIQDIRGVLYMTASEIIFTMAYTIIYELPSETPIYLRENSLYGPAAYYIATFVGLMPRVLLKALIFTTVVYIILHRNVQLIMLLYCLCTSVGAICGTAYGMMISSWFESVEMATTIMVPLDILFILTSGIFYNLRTLPVYLTYLKYFSLFYYINETLAILYWTKIDSIECEEDPSLPCLTSGMEVLLESGYAESNFWWDIGGMILLTISLNFFGYFGARKRRATKSIH